MKYRTLLLFFGIMIFATIGLVAQESLYEKKAKEITYKYLALLNYDKEVERLTKSEKSALDYLILYPCTQNWMCELYKGYERYAQRHGEEASEKLGYNYEMEMKEALKLRTNEERLSRTPMGRILNSIGIAFNDWATKQEFEKESARDARLQQYSKQVFVDLCYAVISNYISSYIEEVRRYIHVDDYDSESEEFHLFVNNWKFNLKIPIEHAADFRNSMNNDDLIEHCVVVSRDPSNFCCINSSIFPKVIVLYNLSKDDIFIDYYGKYNKNKYDNTILNVESTYDFTDNFRTQFYYTELYWEKGIVVDGQRNRISKYSLYCQEEDSIRIKYEDRPHYSLPWGQNRLLRYDIEDVIVCFDDLGIENPYLQGSSFNYTKEKFIPGPYLKDSYENEERKVQQERQFKIYNDSLQDAVKEYNNLLQQYPYNYEVYAISYSLPSDFIGNEQALQDTLHNMLSSISEKLQQLIERYEVDSVYYKLSNDTLQNHIAEYNDKLLSYPYNLSQRIIQDSLSLSLFGKSDELASELRQKILDLPSKHQRVEHEVFVDLRTNQPQRFVSISFSLPSYSKSEADSLYLECRCNYADRLAFDLAYIDKSLKSCNCRQSKYEEVGSLFHSREEFDKSYNQQEKVFYKELEERTNQKSAVSYLENLLKDDPQMSLKKAKSSTKVEILSLLSKIEFHRERYYYSDVMDLVFNYNEKLSKEWSKNGNYFQSKAEMYDIYIGEDYDKELKQRKKDNK